MIQAAAELDRLPRWWRLSHAAERDLRAAIRNYDVIKFAQTLNDEPKSYFGLPVEIVEGECDIEMIVEGDMRLGSYAQPTALSSIVGIAFDTTTRE